MKENSADVLRCSMLAREPVERSSRHTTVWSPAASRSHRCDPRNPAPPVTRTLMTLPPVVAPDLSVAASWTPEAPVIPAGSPPGLRVKAITSVDDALRPGYRFKLFWLQFPEFIPLSENENHIALLACFDGRQRVVERRE